MLPATFHDFVLALALDVGGLGLLSTASYALLGWVFGWTDTWHHPLTGTSKQIVATILPILLSSLAWGIAAGSHYVPWGIESWWQSFLVGFGVAVGGQVVHNRMDHLATHGLTALVTIARIGGLDVAGDARIIGPVVAGDATNMLTGDVTYPESPPPPPEGP